MTGQVQADGACLVAGDRIVMLVHGHSRTGERAADDTLVGVQFGLRFKEDRQMSTMHQITAYRVPPCILSQPKPYGLSWKNRW